MKKIIILLISISILFIPMCVNAEAHYLYDVLKDEAESNGLAREYTGEHHDSFDKEPYRKIYHWYAPTANDTSTIKDKFNVIFANYCWQMIRTTDTGGVKLMYNGKVENGKCLDDRPKTFGYFSYYTNYKPNLARNLWYGTDYTYNEGSGTFKLSGDLTQAIWSPSTSPDLIGKYTCLATSSTSSCSYLYFIESYASETSGYSIHLRANNDYSDIGNVKFDWNGNSLSRIGYMYNKDYDYSYSNILLWGTGDTETRPLLQDEYDVVGNASSTPFIYDSNTNKWFGTVSNNNSSTLLTFKIKENGNYKMVYTTYGSRTTITKNSEVLANVRGSTNGKVEIDLPNLTTEDVIKVKYEKTDSTVVKYEGVGFSMNVNSDNPVDNRFIFGNNVIYNNNEYTLTDYIYAEVGEDLNNNHYTCFTHDNKCEKVYYIYRKYNNLPMYIELENGEKVEDALNNMLNVDNINTKNSIAKTALEKWYEKYFTDYSDYLEETIYCYKRKLSNLQSSGWNPNGGNLDTYLRFDTSVDLSCENETDQFSISNPKAKIKYKVGLMTYPELKTMNYTSAIKAPFTFMVPTPNCLQNEPDIMESASSGNGSVWNTGVTRGNGLKPAISLKPWSYYSSGDGSMENPYVYGGISRKYRISVQVEDETKDINISINDLTRVTDGEEVNINITPIKGFKLNNIKVIDEDNNEIEYTTTDNKNYTFTMPASDVIIKPSYERVKNAVTLEDNKNTKEFIIEVNDSSAVLYEDTVRFRVSPEEGYEVEKIDITDEEQNKINYKKTNNINEYEFTMPDTNVTIKPQYRKIESSTLINPNTNRQILFIIISIIMFVIITTIYTRKKKRLNTN